MFSVYKISGIMSSSTYYGYCVGEDMLESFMKGARRAVDPTIRRGAGDLLRENDSNEDNLTAELVDACTDELEAWCIRNDERSSDIFSITGPSAWPANIAQRASKDHPERVEQWKKNRNINECPTARKAAKLGGFKVSDFKALGEVHGRDAVMKDMDGLNPKQFSEKYSLPINYSI